MLHDAARSLPSMAETQLLARIKQWGLMLVAGRDGKPAELRSLANQQRTSQQCGP